MLSILIPIYNINCTKLVTELQYQCKKNKIIFEILCFDDNSREAFKIKNRQLAFLFGVSYVELTENQGRAKIRNLLAKNSNHDLLLFIDADSKVPNKSYIKNYISRFDSSNVVYGGRLYTKRKPTAKKKIFHWTYGTEREAISAKKRNRFPYLNFMSNNFIIPRTVFDQIKFDPAHEGYGYEDTVFATSIKRLGMKLIHIDNPLIHTGIETVDVFMEKTKNALDNLVLMHRNRQILDTRLIKAYSSLKKWKLDSFVLKQIDKRMDSIIENMYSENPKMRNFDFWKLKYFNDKMQ